MTSADRVRSATDEQVNRRLDDERLQRLAAHADSSRARISEAIDELDHTWDVERVLEANAATLMLASLGLARFHSPRWLGLAAIVPGFLLQHAVQGWCPPILVIRRLGVRTRSELDLERTALKALRGDFRDVALDGASPLDRARTALEAAQRVA